ncbi:MAG: SprB repeat-containing protein, partial [Flavobacteriales bacterium]|nr:SprB repeat-containing protein [Flavobacteriales bacterium]
FSITWSGGHPPGSPLTGLCPSDSPVTVTVTDASGCFKDSIITFSGPPVLDAIITFIPPSCNGGATGQIDIDASGGLPIGGGFDYNYSIDGGGSFTPGVDPFSFINLAAGTYNVIVQDLNGCQYTETIVLVDPAGCLPTTSGTPASCGGVADGTATVDVSSCGAGPFTHQWYEIPFAIAVPVPGGTTPTITGLLSNCYFDSITDLSTGCVFSSDTVCVTENPSITVNVTFTNITCNGFCDGSAAALAASGGVPPYVYEFYQVAAPTNILIQGTTVTNIFGLCAGQYFLELVDQNGCRSAPAIFTILENPPLTAPLVSANASCFGVCDGSATIAPSGGDGTYTVVWDNITTGSLDFDPGAVLSQNALCAGDYLVSVTDGTGCVFGPQAFTIAEDPEVTLAVAITNQQCFGTNSGQAVATPTNGSPIYVYTWSSSGNPGNTEGGLAPGPYTVSVTDGAGCTSAVVPFVIGPVTEILAVLTPSVLPCNGDLGSIAVAPSGGDGTYFYSWDASTGNQTTNPAVGLAPGTYCVDVTDGLGCTVGPFCATIDPVTAVTATNSTTDALCNGVCDGTATVNPSGGTGAGTYIFLWDAAALNQPTQTAVGLCAGIYSCTITDANGCSIVVSGIVVGEATALTLAITPTATTCFGGLDGIATIVETGGTAGFTYQWDATTGPPLGGQTTNPATNLLPGTYNVVVTDANLCSAAGSITIGEAAEITGIITTADATCGLIPCDGSATITPAGGTGPLSQQWFDATPAPLGTGFTESNLCAGAYTVVVTDNVGCSVTFAAGVSNPGGEVLTSSVIQDETCLGDCDGIAEVTYACSTGPLDCTVSWNTPVPQVTDTATALCAGTWIATVTNSNTGCITTTSVTIGDVDVLALAMSATPEQCYLACNGTASVVVTGGSGGYSYLWNDPAPQITSTASNLCGNLTYTVIVTDDNSLCTGTASVNVDTAAQMLVPTTFVDATCDGVCDGIATVLPTGGTGGTFQIQWDDTPAPGQTTLSATGLCVGSYMATVTDSNGCSVTTAPVAIGTPVVLSNIMTSTPLLCNGDNIGTATATPSGGSGIYTYNWQQGGNNLTPPQTTATAVNLPAGTYTVEISDNNGCALIPDDTVVIAAPAAITATFSSTPETCDGDGDGTATVVPAGGTPPPLDITWDATTLFQTGPIATNLPDGT